MQLWVGIPIFNFRILVWGGYPLAVLHKFIYKSHDLIVDYLGCLLL
jgi:hypothetical protein